MRQSIRQWLCRRRRLLLRELIVLLCALALSFGYSLWQSDTFLPSIDGNICSMLALDDSLLMVLSNGNKSSLVRIDHTGALLNYMTTKSGQAFQDLESDGETVYAILSWNKDGTTRQRLVSLSLKNAVMRAKVLTELSNLPGAPVGVEWRELYLVPGGDGLLSIKLTGLDEESRGFLAHWDISTGRARFEEVLPGESILFLKYVQDGHYIWINREKEAGQYIGGFFQRDLLAGMSNTPLHISTCGTRCFISDSISGDIFELLPDGSAIRRRQGGDTIGGSGFQYRALEVYTTYLNRNGAERIIGLCAAENGSVIAGEDWSVFALRPGALGLRMLFQHSRPVFLVIWIVLASFAESVCLILHAPRLSVRLLLSEVIAAVILLTGVTGIQYRSFRETIREEAYQKLRLIGGSLAGSLDGPANDASPGLAAGRLKQQISAAMAGQKTDYQACVIWDTEQGPIVASASGFPDGYLLEDVASREYLRTVSRVLRQGGAVLERIQTDSSCDYLYVQSFFQGGRIGCVAVSQGEGAILAGQARFFQRLLPVLAACPILFLALFWITRRLLKPLDEIRRALEAFYTEGSGGQMRLDDMPRTELYEMGRVFNQLSTQTKVQFNELQSINDAYARLVPDCLLSMLHAPGVTALNPGDRAPVDGALLILIPRDRRAGRVSPDRLTGLASEPVVQGGGMLVDYDEGLNALTALFPQADSARACGISCLDRLEQEGISAMAAVLEERVELGVFGSEHLLYPLALSKEMRRKQAALERVLDFGAPLVQAGCAGRTQLRLLGWDGNMELYEDPALHPSDWQSRWRQSAGLWEEALRLFREMDFPAAMRLFAKVLRLMPEDMAARWYLFRCEALRDGVCRPSDTGLLFDWEEPGYERKNGAQLGAR